MSTTGDQQGDQPPAPARTITLIPRVQDAVLSVADAVQDVVVQLAKGPLTPAKLAKAEKKLRCWHCLSSILGVKAEDLAPSLGISVEEAWLQLAATTQLAAQLLAAQLVRVICWLTAPDAAALWLQHAAAKRLATEGLTHLNRLVTRLFWMPRTQEMEFGRDALEGAMHKLLAAGWLQSLPQALDALASYATQKLDFNSAMAVVDIGTCLEDVCWKYLGRSSPESMQLALLTALRDADVLEKLCSSTLLMHNAVAANPLAAAAARGFDVAVRLCAEQCQCVVTQLCIVRDAGAAMPADMKHSEQSSPAPESSTEYAAPTSKDDEDCSAPRGASAQCAAPTSKHQAAYTGQSQQLCTAALNRPSIFELAEAATAARLVPFLDGVPAAVRRCHTPKRKLPQLPVTRGMPLAQTCDQYIAISALHCSLGEPSCYADAGTALLLLQVLVLGDDQKLPTTEQDRWEKLAGLLWQLDDTQLQAFARKGGACLVRHISTLCAAAAAGKQVLFQKGKAKDALVGAMMVLQALISPCLGSPEGFQHTQCRHSAPPGVVWRLASAAGGQLFTAMQQLLRSCRIGRNDAVLVTAVLQGVLSNASFLLQLLNDSSLSQALYGVIASLGKWLLVMEGADYWIDRSLLQPEARDKLQQEIAYSMERKAQQLQHERQRMEQQLQQMQAQLQQVQQNPRAAWASGATDAAGDTPPSDSAPDSDQPQQACLPLTLDERLAFQEQVRDCAAAAAELVHIAAHAAGLSWRGCVPSGSASCACTASHAGTAAAADSSIWDSPASGRTVHETVQATATSTAAEPPDQGSLQHSQQDSGKPHHVSSAQERALAQLALLVFCRVGGPTALVLEKLICDNASHVQYTSDQHVNAALDDLCYAAGAIGGGWPALTSALQAAVGPDSYGALMSARVVKVQHADMQEQQQQVQQGEQAEEEQDRQAEEQWLPGGIEDTAHGDSADAGAHPDADVEEEAQTWLAAVNMALRHKLLLHVELPRHLLPGCHNPRCTNMQAACEAHLKTKKCTGCGIRVFCSKRCLKEAWPQHRAACKQAAVAAAAVVEK